MKKLLVVLLILSVAGGMFAVDIGEGFTIGGQVKSGFGVFSQDDGADNGDDTYIKAWNDDAGAIFRGRLNFGWEGDVGGTKFRLQAKDSDSVTMPKAFGWVNLLDKKIVIWGGHGVDPLYDVYGTVLNTDIDDADQVRLEVRPIEGLKFSFALPIPIGGITLQKTSSSVTSSDERLSLANTFGGSIFGAKYKNDTFTAQAVARLNPGKKGTYWGIEHDDFLDNTQDGGLDKYEILEGQEEDSFVEILYGLMIPSVLPVGIEITGAFESGDAGYFRIAPKVTWASGKIDAHVQGDINMDLDDKHGQRAAGKSNFNVVKEEGDAGIGLEIGAGYKLSDIIGLYLNVGSHNIGYIDGNGFFVKPGATFALGPNTNIEIFDKLSNIAADGDIKKGGLALYKLSNQLQVEFVWTF